MMDNLELIMEIDRLIRNAVPYKIGGRNPAEGFDCEGYVRYLFTLCRIELHDNIYAASKEFKVIIPPYQFLDVAVMRCDGPLDRHLALFVDRSWLTHCSVIGISKIPLNRAKWEISHVARHRSLWN